MSRIVLVHGSVADGPTTWSAQEPLEDSYEVIVLDRPEAPTYEEQAEWVAGKLKNGDHLVGHSTGGTIALLAAARVTAKLGSLCLLEPTALALAADQADVAAATEALQALWASDTADPRAFLVGFFEALYGEAAAPALPDPLTPAQEQGARRLQLEQAPWDVAVPIEELAARRIPTLVMTGGWSPALDAVAAVLAEGLRGKVLVKAGGRHDIQRANRFNEALERFVSASSRDRR